MDVTVAEVVLKMLPYFFAAGHQNYARYGLFYLRAMEKMPVSVMKKFLNGDHVMRHMPGFWTGMEFRAICGLKPHSCALITLKPETLKTWTLSLHICTQLEEDLVSISQEECQQKAKQHKHKEEMKTRIITDNKDREGLRHQLQNYIDPLNLTPTLYNF